MQLQTGRVEFPGAEGQMLSARIDMPGHLPRAWALFAHCFSCSKDVHAASRIAHQLVARGLGVTKADHPAAIRQLTRIRAEALICLDEPQSSVGCSKF